MTQTQVPTYSDPTQTTEPAILGRLDAGATLGLALNEGQDDQDILAATSIELAQASYLASFLLAQVFVSTATGSALDDKGADLNVPRKQPVPSQYTITVTGSAGDVLPQGQLIGTSPLAGVPSVTFFVTQAATIAAGQTSVTANVQAVIPGTAGNVSLFAIAIFVGTTPPGLTSVEGTTQIDVGEDLEGDGPAYSADTSFYRGRLLEAMRDPGSSGNPAHYMTWMTEQPVVSRAAVVRTWEGPGTVGLAFLDAQGNIPTLVEVHEVENALINPLRFYYEAISLAVSGYGVTLTGPNDGTGDSAAMAYNASGAGVLTLSGLDQVLGQPGIWRLLLLVQVSSSAGTANLLTAQVNDLDPSAPCPISPSNSSPCTTTWKANQLPTSFGASTFLPATFGWLELDFFWEGTHPLSLTITRDVADTTTTLDVGTILFQSSFSSDQESGSLVPIGDWASVMPPLAVTVTLAATLEYAAGADKPTVQGLVTANWEAYLQSIALLPAPQNTVYFGGAIMAIMQTGGQQTPGLVGFVPALLLNGAQADVIVPDLSVATNGGATLA